MISVVDSAVKHAANSPVVSKNDPPLLLVLPGLFVFLAFMLFLVLYLVYLSFIDAEPAILLQDKEQWVDLANYVTVFSDSQFWNSMGVTQLFVAASVALKVLVGLGIGLVVTGERVRGKWSVRALIIIPLSFPGVFTITIWRDIFSSVEFSLANQFLRMAGLGSIAQLSERWIAFLTYDVTEAWLAHPFMVIITVSALQDVSEELYEATMIDGAGFLAHFLHVALPSIERPMLFASILAAAASSQQFLIPHVFNQRRPSRMNRLLIVRGYREVFRFQKYGEGAAIMLVAVAVIGVFMILNVKKGQFADGMNDV